MTRITQRERKGGRLDEGLELFAFGNRLHIRVVEALTKEMCDRIVELLDEHVQIYGNLYLLIEFQDRLDEEVVANWSEASNDVEEWGCVDRLALVAASEWEGPTRTFQQPFSPDAVRLFEPAQFEEAKQWIESEG